MHTENRKKRRYITGFDGLRSLGVVAVILYHLNPGFFKGGYLGVLIFMVLSGYLITDHLVQTLQTDGRFDFKHFWQRRLKRLYPALITMLLVCCAYIVLFQRSLLANLHRIVLTNLLYVYNWWQIANGQSYFERFANNASPFTHLWTLSIEGQFYLLWPLVVVLLWRRWRKRQPIFWTSVGLALFSAILMAVLFRPNVDPSRVYYGTDTRLFALLFGCGLAMIWPSEHLRLKVARRDRLWLDGLGLLGLGGMLLLMFKLDAQSAFLYRGGMVLFSIFVVLLVAVVAHPGADWNRLLSNSVFSWLGSRSYGLYLYQFPVMIFFENKVVNIADHPVLYPLIELALIFLISEGLYRAVEQPLRHFDYHKSRTYLHELLQKTSDRQLQKRQLLVATLALTAVIGLFGIGSSFTVKANTAEHTEVAKKIDENKKQTAKQNKEIAASIKAAKASEKKAAKHDSSQSQNQENPKPPVPPVDPQTSKDLAKYGLTKAQLQKGQQLPITGIGDSIMLGSAAGYRRIFPKMYLSASVSEQVYQIPERIEALLKQGLVSETVLIGLGTNGSFRQSDLDRIMKLLGPKRRVFWINVRVPTRPWQNQVNADLKAGAKRYDNLEIIDWYQHAKDHPEWFAKDHVHPNTKGSPYYYTFVAKKLLSALS